MEFAFTDLIEIIVDALNVVFQGNVPEVLLTGIAFTIIH